MWERSEAQMAGSCCYGCNGQVFRRCGIATLSDLKTSEWGILFTKLESVQSEFLAKEAEFRSPDYQWPSDSLHTWSRVWEYSYTYDFLFSWRKELGSAPVVADVGSGVTFFPIAAARLGYTVVCTDIDPVCGQDLPRAARVVPHGPGTMSFRLMDSAKLPFEDEEVDALYCISVLEHIPDFENMIVEMARVLKPSGRLILTVDLDLNGKHEIGVERYLDLRTALRQCFDLAAPEVTVHPADQLTTINGPYPLRTLKGIDRFSFQVRQRIKPWFGRKPDSLMDYELCVAGFVLRRY